MDKDWASLVYSVKYPPADVVKVILNSLIWGILDLDNFVLELVFELRIDSAHSLDDMGDTSRFQSFQVLGSSYIADIKIRHNSVQRHSEF